VNIINGTVTLIKLILPLLHQQVLTARICSCEFLTLHPIERLPLVVALMVKCICLMNLTQVFTASIIRTSYIHYATLFDWSRFERGLEPSALITNWVKLSSVEMARWKEQTSAPLALVRYTQVKQCTPLRHAY
jgi:hypothetical protein